MKFEDIIRDVLKLHDMRTYRMMSSNFMTSYTYILSFMLHTSLIHLRYVARMREYKYKKSLRLRTSFEILNIDKKIIPWPESASEIYLPSDRHLSAKLVPNFADRGCNVVSMTDPYGHTLGSQDGFAIFPFK
jgi:hypothetical protein